MKIKVNNIHHPETEIKALAVILVRLRQSTKHWQKHYGANNRKVMRLWEQRADQWLNDHIEHENHQSD